MEVIAEVDKEGRVTILMRGFRGQACVPEASRIIELLKSKGVEVHVQEAKPTEEMYQEERERVYTG